MRIVLQQKSSGLYFADVNAWVRNSSQAMDFVSSSAASEFCALNHLAGLQIVLKFDEQAYDIVLPVAQVAADSGRPHAEAR